MHKQLIIPLADVCTEPENIPDRIRETVNRPPFWRVAGGGVAGDELILSLEPAVNREAVPDYFLFRMADLDKRTLLSEISRLFYDGFSVTALLSAGENRWILASRERQS